MGNTLVAMVVGLENDDRGGPLEAQLSGYDIPFTRMPGCSQRDAWSALLASDSPFALVFNDDAILTQSPVDEDVLRVLSTGDPAVVLLGPDGTNVSRWSRPIGDVYRLKGSAPGACAYALNRAAAKALLAGRAPAGSSTDWPPRVAHKVAFHVTSPQRAISPS